MTVENVSGTTNRITATTMDEADQGIHSMKLIVSLGDVNYPKLEVPF